MAERIVGSFDDPDCLHRFADGLDLVTYEFENVPIGAARLLAERVPVYPPPAALEVEPGSARREGVVHATEHPHDAVRCRRTRRPIWSRPLEELGCPAVLKTRRLGYDGKGQAVLRGRGRRGPGVACGWAVSRCCWRNSSPSTGNYRKSRCAAETASIAFYPLVENHHEHGILRWSLAPAPGVPPELQAAASDYALRILRELDYVGVLAVEFFQRGDGLIANEMAPRVHNSGHWTIEGAETSQFENHLRAVVGWPLGSTAAVGRSAMLNLIGDDAGHGGAAGRAGRARSPVRQDAEARPEAGPRHAAGRRRGHGFAAACRGQASRRSVEGDFDSS